MVSELHGLNTAELREQFCDDSLKQKQQDRSRDPEFLRQEPNLAWITTATPTHLGAVRGDVEDKQGPVQRPV